MLEALQDRARDQMVALLESVDSSVLMEQVQVSSTSDGFAGWSNHPKHKLVVRPEQPRNDVNGTEQTDAIAATSRQDTSLGMRKEAEAMQETIIAEQMRLREEAEFAKYEKDDAERKVQEIENLATQLWSQLENAGIDPGSHLRFTPIERQPYTSPTPQIDPQMEELTKKLLQTDDDLEQLMAEILEDTMEVEMAASKEELEKVSILFRWAKRFGSKRSKPAGRRRVSAQAPDSDDEAPAPPPWRTPARPGARPPADRRRPPTTAAGR